MCKLQDNIFDEPHVQGTEEDHTKQAAGSRGTILGRGTGRIQERQEHVQQILILKLMAEQAWQKRQLICNCFIDFSKAFDTIKHDVTWTVMDSFRVDGKITRLQQNIYRGSVAAARVGQQEG